MCSFLIWLYRSAIQWYPHPNVSGVWTRPYVCMHIHTLCTAWPFVLWLCRIVKLWSNSINFYFFYKPYAVVLSVSQAMIFDDVIIQRYNAGKPKWGIYSRSISMNLAMHVLYVQISKVFSQEIMCPFQDTAHVLNSSSQLFSCVCMQNKLILSINAIWTRLD